MAYNQSDQFFEQAQTPTVTLVTLYQDKLIRFSYQKYIPSRYSTFSVRRQ
jgi:hypothetical protein